MSIDYYLTQSAVTDAMEYQYLFNDLPQDIPSLCEVLQGILLHELDGYLFNYTIPQQRIQETSLRYVRKMLAHIVTLDKRSLIYARPPEKRLIATCRDFAVLLCAFLRYQNIPARLRIGFSTYLYPNTNFRSSHALAEYWNAALNQWCLVDARISPAHIAKNKQMVDFNIYDIPHHRFLFAGKAWHLCRGGEFTADSFGFRLINRLKGWWFIRDKVIQDLAALNKQEPLMWDLWGLMLQQEMGVVPSDKQTSILDQIAALTLNNQNENITSLQTLYNTYPDLAVPKKMFFI